LVSEYRKLLEVYIKRHPEFMTSLKPLEVNQDAPIIVKEMAWSAAKVDVGPMAAVAGAIAEFVGKELLPFTTEIIIENGGDIFLKSRIKRTIGIYAGISPLTGRIGLEIDGKDTPLGICTSSGTVGHSLSFGKADAVIIVAASTSLADAAATAIGNTINHPDDISKGIEFAESIEGLTGAIIIKDDKMGICGDILIRRISAN